MLAGAGITSEGLVGRMPDARSDAGWGACPRDDLLAAALDVGMARRGGDLRSLRSGWARVRRILVTQSVDLYSLPVLGVRRLGCAPAGVSVQSLSEREREVAALVLTGLTYREIGERLFISVKRSSTTWRACVSGWGRRVVASSSSSCAPWCAEFATQRHAA